MVTILIPAANRPGYLRTALASVAAQTAVDEIVEVIVSESTGNSRTGDVCREFPQLPIKYILRDDVVRDPLANFVHHFSALSTPRWAGEFTVMLHDDDWWTPDFLCKGIDALRANSKASTFCCLSFNIEGERASKVECDSIPVLFFWFGARYPDMAPLWSIDREGMVMSCILDTPAHYATILARAEAYRQSALIYETGNRWDVDRMLLSELSRHGDILFSPIAHAYYRRHALQASHLVRVDNRKRQMPKTTEWIIERSGEDRADLADRFYERIRCCPEEGRAELYFRLAMPWALPALVAPLDPAHPVARFSRRLRNRMRVRKALHLVLPPPWFFRIEPRFFRPL
jgi:hypothetical protein